MPIKKATRLWWLFAPSPDILSNKFKEDLRKIYDLKPFVEVSPIDFDKTLKRLKANMGLDLTSLIDIEHSK